MTTKSNNIDYLISEETSKLKKKAKNLKSLEFFYKEEANGVYSSTLKAKTNKKFFALKEENHCPRKMIRKVFSKISRLLSVKRVKKKNINFYLKEVL